MRVAQRDDAAGHHDAAFGQDKVRNARPRVGDGNAVLLVKIPPALVSRRDAGRWRGRAVVEKRKNLALEREFLDAEVLQVSLQPVDLFHVGRDLNGKYVRL